MSQNEKDKKITSLKSIVAASKRSLEIYGGCFERVCTELASLSGLVDRLEEENKALEKRVLQLELLCGVAETSRLADSTFGKVKPMPEVS